ncbi:MAG TPA: hypothetical protein VIL00_18855 [Pseudonocardiaceae bacterium]
MTEVFVDPPAPGDDRPEYPTQDLEYLDRELDYFDQDPEDRSQNLDHPGQAPERPDQGPDQPKTPERPGQGSEQPNQTPEVEKVLAQARKLTQHGVLGDIASNSGWIGTRVEGDFNFYAVYSDGTSPKEEDDDSKTYKNIISESEHQARGAHAVQVTGATHITWLRERFVAPDGFEQARSQLTCSADPVFLAGTPGSGRRTAARMLLCPPGVDTLYELAPEHDDIPGLVSGLKLSGPDDRLLLDLGEADPERFARWQHELEALADVVRRQDARLVVVLPEGHQRLLDHPHWRWVVTIGRPDPRQVLRRYLAQEQVAIDEEHLDSEALTAFLHNAPMEEVARLAALIVEAARRPGAAPDPKEWLSAALSALTDLSEKVGETLTQHGEGADRALLLSVAMLEGAAVHAVHYAEQQLLRLTDHPESEVPRLSRDGLINRIRKLDASVVDRRVRFNRLAYGSAVLDRFWDEYPGLREQLNHWIMLLGRARNVLTLEDRQRVARHAGEQWLRIGDIGGLLWATKSWAQDSNTQISSLAYIVLARAAVDERHGAAVRRALYYWARETTLPRSQASVLIAVCVEVLAPRYPDAALSRLWLLRGHRNSRIAQEAREALAALAVQDHRFPRRLLTRLTEWSPFDGDLFLALVDAERQAHSQVLPRLLAEDPDVRAQVITGWREVLAHHPVSPWAEAVQHWLDLAAQHPEHASLPDLLVEACAGHAGLLARLYRVARDWIRNQAEPAEPAARARTAAHLLDAINRAAGLGAPVPPPVTTLEENVR